METVNASDLKKTGATKMETPVIISEKKKTASDLFCEELNEDQKVIFEEIKTTLIQKRRKYEFEVIQNTQESFDSYAVMIEYIENGILTIEEDGVDVKLRLPLSNKDGIVLANSLKILFERNEDRENVIKKAITTNIKNKTYNDEVAMAILTASLANVDNRIISTDSILRMKKTNYDDYQLLFNVFIFFRS